MKWKPMRSAPKDGTEFVAAFVRPFVFRQVEVISWLEDESCWWSGGCPRWFDEDFKGWVPLPA